MMVGRDVLRMVMVRTMDDYRDDHDDRDDEDEHDYDHDGIDDGQGHHLHYLHELYGVAPHVSTYSAATSFEKCGWNTFVHGVECLLI